jgi:D-alanine-D-alanine ligase
VSLPRVLVLHTLPPRSVSDGRSRDEFDLSEAAAAIAAVLPDARVAGVEGGAREILALLEQQEPDVVFNACEAPLGRPDLEAHLASLLEWSGVRFTGCGSETLALCRRKDRAGAALTAAGLAVPREGVFPCIVKPADEDGSAGITAGSVCSNEEELARARARWEGPVIVQEFLPGREFAVSLWGAREPEHSSIGEFCFREGLMLNTYASKWDSGSEDFANSPLFYDSKITEALRAEVLRQACGTWRAVEARGYLRVDLRLDAGGQPHVLDVNPNPELAPGVGIHRAVMEAGWTWERFVRQQVLWA